MGISRAVSSVFLDHSSGLSVVAFWEAVATRGYTDEEAFHWPTVLTEFEVPGGGEVLAITTRHGHVNAVVEFDGAILQLNLFNGNVSGSAIAESGDQARAIVAIVEECFPRSIAAEDEVPVSFWSYTPNGPRSISRRITVPSWGAVEGNYGGDTYEGLDRMMTGFRPSHGGQLILWQGIPGTGKTWALRALASEWREWADLHYITDPEIFFGEKADYMLDVLLDDADDLIQVGDDGDEIAAGGRWRVLLLEDTGEILAADAKEKTGQALSRLLNVVDGLIGQGLRILVLVTTNEELKKLHPAVSRPGRCAARIEFGPFKGSEGKAWANAHGVAFDGDGQKTIAELYALLDKREAYEEVPVGFVQ